MKLTEALRWTIYYRGIALFSFLLGIGLAGAGIWFGFVDLVLNQVPGQSGSGSIEMTNIVLGSLLILFGFVVWQIGKTAAFYMTLTEATESEMADRFDTQTVKSEILDVLDDRLADIHDDVETTRQQVNRLGIDEHAEALTTELDDEPEPARTGQDSESSQGSDRPTRDQQTKAPTDDQ